MVPAKQQDYILQQSRNPFTPAWSEPIAELEMLSSAAAPSSQHSYHLSTKHRILRLVRKMTEAELLMTYSSSPARALRSVPQSQSEGGAGIMRKAAVALGRERRDQQRHPPIREPRLL